jgi:predicted XRE-type DNA-binding protein
MRSGVPNKKSKGPKKRATRVEASSGNVFADLGLPEPDELLAKAELARRICASITERGLTQEEAATVLGVDQPKVSALMRGKLSGFSTDRLFRFLNALGQDVEIVIRSRRRGSNRPRTRVISA